MQLNLIESQLASCVADQLRIRVNEYSDDVNSIRHRIDDLPRDLASDPARCVGMQDHADRVRAGVGRRESVHRSHHATDFDSRAMHVWFG